MDKVKKERKPRVPKCKSCGISKTEDPTVQYRLDPYLLDIAEKRVWGWTCDKCDHESAMDI